MNGEGVQTCSSAKIGECHDAIPGVSGYKGMTQLKVREIKTDISEGRSQKFGLNCSGCFICCSR